MKVTRNIVNVMLACLASVGFAGTSFSFWYLWHLASRVPDPSRGLVHSRVLGDAEAGAEFSVYLSSKESPLLFPELYLVIFGVALLLLSSRLSWKLPLRKP